MSDSSPSSADVEAIEEFPEDPRLRVMRRLVNTLLVIMIGGFLAVVIAIIWGLKVQMRAIEAQPAIRGLQSDERIMSATATADRLTLVLENTQGTQRIIILDAETYRALDEVGGKID